MANCDAISGKLCLATHSLFHGTGDGGCLQNTEIRTRRENDSTRKGESSTPNISSKVIQTAPAWCVYDVL